MKRERSTTPQLEKERKRDAARLRIHGLTLLCTVVVVLGGAVLLYDSSPNRSRPGLGFTPFVEPNPSPPPTRPPTIGSYEPSSAEEIPNGKQLAAEVAQSALTYPRYSTLDRQALSLKRFGARVAPGVIRPTFDPESRSWAKVIYPQLSGFDGATMGAMVVVEQTVEGPDRRRRTESRVLDVRLQLVAGRWRLDTLASTGGSPPKSPTPMTKTAKRVLSDSRIELPDSGRWDIERGLVDETLLSALCRAAEWSPIRVAVLITGQPASVWATERRSAHSAGLAADIFAVGGREVIRQRQIDSSAHRLAASFLEGGAVQVGSPWVLESEGVRSFTNVVHQDHIHLQQSGGV